MPLVDNAIKLRKAKGSAVPIFCRVSWMDTAGVNRGALVESPSGRLSEGRAQYKNNGITVDVEEVLWGW